MLSIPDMALLGAAALLLFGPEQMPRVARKAGMFMREVQNTSQSFIREMERAADVHETPKPYDAAPYDAAAYDPAPGEAASYEPATYEPAAYEPAPYDAGAYEPAAPDPEPHVPHPVAERLAEPRGALGLEPSQAAEPAPQPDHSPHV